MAKSEKWTADIVVELIRARFGDSKRYFVCEQVADATGLSCRSWVDAMVVSLWPSDGLWRSAFEVKVSRQDFLREVGNPGKNDWARRACEYFWFAAPAGVVAHLDEIPAGCGYMEAQRGRLVIRKQAPLNNDAVVGPELLASLARSLGQERDRELAMVGRRFREGEEFAYIEGCRKAVEAFLIRHGVSYPYPTTVESVGEALEKAAQSPEYRQQEAGFRRMVDDARGLMEASVESLLVAMHATLSEMGESSLWTKEEVVESNMKRAAQRARERGMRRRRVTEVLQATAEAQGTTD